MSSQKNSANDIDMVLLREPLAGFAISMEKVLQKNDYKGGWQGLAIEHLLSRLDQERDELLIAIHEGSTLDEIQHECCDVANLAMMIFDNLERRRFG